MQSREFFLFSLLEQLAETSNEEERIAILRKLNKALSDMLPHGYLAEKDYQIVKQLQNKLDQTDEQDQIKLKLNTLNNSVHTDAE